MSIYNSRKKPKLLDHQLQYIDPVDCHSMVGYTLSTTDYGGLRCTVDLGSCDRRIAWEFDSSNDNDYERSKVKIANAIAVLRCFQNAYQEHARKYIDSKKRKKKK